MTAMLEVIDAAALTSIPGPTRQVAQLLSEDLSRSEIARQLGQSESWVSQRVEELKEAMLAATGPLEGGLRERADQLRRNRSSTADPAAGEPTSRRRTA